MNFTGKDNDFKQVRTVKGTRNVSLDRTTTVREIQEMAESLFSQMVFKILEFALESFESVDKDDLMDVLA